MANASRMAQSSGSGFFLTSPFVSGTQKIQIHLSLIVGRFGFDCTVLSRERATGSTTIPGTLVGFERGDKRLVCESALGQTKNHSLSVFPFPGGCVTERTVRNTKPTTKPTHQRIHPFSILHNMPRPRRPNPTRHTNTTTPAATALEENEDGMANAVEPVATLRDGVWQTPAVPPRWVTPQHLGTLLTTGSSSSSSSTVGDASSSRWTTTTTSCRPILVDNRHLVVGCGQNNRATLAIWDLGACLPVLLPAAQTDQNRTGNIPNNNNNNDTEQSDNNNNSILSTVDSATSPTATRLHPAAPSGSNNNSIPPTQILALDGATGAPSSSYTNYRYNTIVHMSPVLRSSPPPSTQSSPNANTTKPPWGILVLSELGTMAWVATAGGEWSVVAVWATGRVGVTAGCCCCCSSATQSTVPRRILRATTMTTEAHSTEEPIVDVPQQQQQQPPPIVVVVGYEGGYMEAWSLPRRAIGQQQQGSNTKMTTPIVSAQKSTAADSSSSAKTEASDTPSNLPHSACLAHATDDDDKGLIQLQWRARFSLERGPPPSIVGIAPFDVVSPLPPAPTNRSSTTSTPNLHAVPKEKDVEQSIASKLAHDYLVLTLHYHDSITRPTTAAMVEVIDVASIAKAWKLLAPQENDRSNDIAVPIEEHCILPEAGREIVDVSTILEASSSGKKRLAPVIQPQWIPSDGTNSVCPVGRDASMCARTDDATVVAGLADGMVTVLSAKLWPSSSGNGKLFWGVSSDMDQICLSYPCIGMGCVNMKGRTGDHAIPHIACCLRGTTTYLIPLDSGAAASENRPKSQESRMLAFFVPSDAQDGTGMTVNRYLQSFAAFDLATTSCLGTGEGFRKSFVPIVVYVWPGGIIDLYSCGLLPQLTSATDEQLPNAVSLLDELVTNGSVKLLRQLLMQSENKLDGQEDEVWKNARAEVLIHGDTVPITRHDVDSKQFLSFRSVLLQLSHR